jgi:hypothetical protein
MRDDDLLSLGDLSSNMFLDRMATDDFLLPLTTFDEILNPKAALQSAPIRPDSHWLASVNPASSTCSPPESISYCDNTSSMTAASEHRSLSSSPGGFGIDFDTSADKASIHTPVFPLPSSPPPARTLSFSGSQNAVVSTRPCKCLADQAGLLVYLKDQSSLGTGSRVDAALLGTSRALAVLHLFLRCGTCWPGARGCADVLESLALAAMNAGLLVRVLQAQVQSLLASNGGHDDDNDDKIETEHPVHVRLGVYAAGPAEARMLSATLLFRATNQVDAVLSRLRVQAERLVDMEGGRSRRSESTGEPGQKMDHAGNGDGGWELPWPSEDEDDSESGSEEDNNGRDNARQARQVQRTLYRLEQNMRRLRERAHRSVHASFQSG